MDRLCERDPWYDEKKRYNKEEDMRTLIADGDYDLPLSCPCGGRIIEETSTEEPIGNKYLTCNVFKNYGLRIRKLWSLAIEEEVAKLRKEFDEKFKEDISGLHEFYIKTLRRKLENNVEEIANLKELLARLVARIEKLFSYIP